MNRHHPRSTSSITSRFPLRVTLRSILSVAVLPLIAGAAVLLAGCSTSTAPGSGSPGSESGTAAGHASTGNASGASPGSGTVGSTSGIPSGSSAASSAASAATTITIKNFAFTVSGSAAPGARVSVHNDDTTTHTVTADTGHAFDVTVEPGKTATFTAPGRAGSYKFHCTFHADMHGVLHVH